ncbi:Leucine aminopeptidase 1 [Claviceps sorghi]|nr:Leucine aminopeptidase 1 [Claviceps sorghi]
MKFIHALLAAGAPLASARFFQQGETDNVVLNPHEEFLIETAPGETQWVTEDEKWELRRNGQKFMDITATRDLGHAQFAAQRRVEFPKKCVQHEAVGKLIPELDKKRMRENLQKLTSFHTRYYNSDYGRQSSEWVLERVRDVIKRAGAEGKVTARSFPHTWKQSSVIATIPGKSNRTIIVGAHQDSINLWLPILAAPGADDDGSGTVTIMEVFAALLASEHVVAGKAENTIEFHWYSAEEGGLLGSQAIFKEYEHDGRDVKAMLQQDMTGFSKGTLDAGLPESVGVIIDYVDAGLTKFIKLVIEQYCQLPWVETKCGYACSDHASASKAGYPSAFVIESQFDKSNQDIHTTSDTLDKLSFDHMLQHAKMTLGFVYELALHEFAP